MKLTDYRLEDFAGDGATLTLRHPSTGVSLDAQMTVLGEDAAALRKLREGFFRKWERMGKTPKTSDYKDFEKDVLAAAVVDWKNIESGDGTAIECTDDNKRLLFADPNNKWIVEQINAFMGDRANFFKSAADN